jgi:predicted DNA binding CopG/RHH family protein
MRAEYDFSKMKGRRNPYAARLKRPVTIRLSSDIVAYFKNMAAEMDVPYQKLMNMYLRDCVVSHRKVEWVTH